MRGTLSNGRPLTQRRQAFFANGTWENPVVFSRQGVWLTCQSGPPGPGGRSTHVSGPLEARRTRRGPASHSDAATSPIIIEALSPHPGPSPHPFVGQFKDIGMSVIAERVRERASNYVRFAQLCDIPNAISFH